MSQMRGTKFSWVGRVSARSSRNVERSARAAKFTVPPLASAPYRMPRPITWLIGMKLSAIDGTTPWLSSQWALAAGRQMLATLLSGYMAPLGAPVLPDV